MPLLNTFSDLFIENIYNNVLLNIDSLLSNQKYNDIFNPITNKTTKYYINQGYSLKKSYALSITMNICFITHLNIC